MFNLASSLETRNIVYVSTNVMKGRPQLNSHSSDCYNREQIDGFEAWDLAGLHTEYVGNDWQDKYVEFVEKWGETE